ncbi:MAG: hypothetical protein QMD82_04175 [bacterium]|nr:hypothetical protein [bacterium]
MRIVLFYCLIFLQTPDYLRREAQVDLNGDGFLDLVNLTNTYAEGEFTLNIKNLQFYGELCDSVKGNTIKPLRKLSRWPHFSGNGIIYIDDWMGLWKKREKYVLNQRTEELERVPQEFYYVGAEAPLTKSFPIYRTRENNKVVAYLREKSNIFIIFCEPKDSNLFKHQYLIKSKSGLLGWASLESFEYKVEGLLWPD